MIWMFILGVAFLGAFAAIVRLRLRISPGSVLVIAFPLLLVSLWLQFSDSRFPADVEAATGKETYDLRGRLFTLEGKSVDATEYEGKLLFVNFWATWCGPCRAEMPSMAKLYEQLGDEGMVMLAITDEDPETVRQYLEDSPFPFTILLDRDAILFRKLRVRGLPTTFVFNRKSELLLEHVGGYDWNKPELIKEFRRIISETE